MGRQKHHGPKKTDEPPSTMHHHHSEFKPRMENRPWSEALIEGMAYEFRNFTPDIGQEMGRPIRLGASVSGKGYLRIASVFTAPLLPAVFWRTAEGNEVNLSKDVSLGEQLAFAALLQEGGHEPVLAMALAFAILGEPKTPWKDCPHLALGVVEFDKEKMRNYVDYNAREPNACFGRGVYKQPSDHLQAHPSEYMLKFLNHCIYHCLALPSATMLEKLAPDIPHRKKEDPLHHLVELGQTAAALGGNLAGFRLFSEIEAAPADVPPAGRIARNKLPPVTPDMAGRFYVFARGQDEIEFANHIVDYAYSAKKITKPKRDERTSSSFSSLVSYAIAFGDTGLLDHMKKVAGGKVHADKESIEILSRTIGFLPHGYQIVKDLHINPSDFDVRWLGHSVGAFGSFGIASDLLRNVPDGRNEWGASVTSAVSACRTALACHLIDLLTEIESSRTIYEMPTSRYYLKDGEFAKLHQAMFDERINEVRLEYCRPDEFDLLVNCTESFKPKPTVPQFPAAMIFGTARTGQLDVLQSVAKKWPEVLKDASYWTTFRIDGDMQFTNVKPQEWLDEEDILFIENTPVPLEQIGRRYTPRRLTALQMAGMYGHVAVLEWVSQNVAVADLNEHRTTTTNEYECPPISGSALDCLVLFACRTGNDEALKFAASHGFTGWTAQIDCIFGMTPAHIAAANHHPNILQTLQQVHGVALDGAKAPKDRKGRQPTYYAQDPLAVLVE